MFLFKINLSISLIFFLVNIEIIDNFIFDLQGYFYYHHLSADRNLRDMYADYPHFQATVDFCEKYDAEAFDPGYESLDLDFFKPMVKRIFSRKPYFNDPNNPKAPAVTGTK